MLIYPFIYLDLCTFFPFIKCLCAKIETLKYFFQIVCENVYIPFTFSYFVVLQP